MFKGFIQSTPFSSTIARLFHTCILSSHLAYLIVCRTCGAHIACCFGDRYSDDAECVSDFKFRQAIFLGFSLPCQHDLCLVAGVTNVIPCFYNDHHDIGTVTLLFNVYLCK